MSSLPGEILRNLHTKSGKTQREVCASLGIDTGNYSRMLANKDMMFSTFVKVAGELGYKVKIEEGP